MGVTAVNLVMRTPLQLWVAMQADNPSIGYTFTIALGAALAFFSLIPAFGLIAEGTPAG